MNKENMMNKKNSELVFEFCNRRDRAVPKRPGGAGVKRKLPFIWIVDVSGSMKNCLNTVTDTMKSCLPAMRDENHANPNAELMVRTMKFSTKAEFMDELTPVDDYEVPALQAGGLTNIGQVFELLDEELNIEKMGKRGLKPVLPLLCDGVPTDDWQKSLAVLKKNPWFEKSVKVAIAIGCDVDNDLLNAYTGNPEMVFTAQNAAQLSNLIKWASTLVNETPLSMYTQPVPEDEGVDSNGMPVMDMQKDKKVFRVDDDDDDDDDDEIVDLGNIAPPERS